MSTKFLIFLIMLWVILAFIGAGIEAGLSPGAAYGFVEEESTLEILMSFRVFKTIEVAGVVPIPVPNMDWFEALIAMFTFDFIFFQGTSYGTMLHWIFFAPIAIAMAITFGLALVRGVGST